jgi:hypothetical protein
MKASKHGPVWIVGWREWIALPELGIAEVKAKLDTGARSSALHVSDVERFRRGGRSMIRFVIHPAQRQALPKVVAEAELIAERRVRSSSGQLQMRPVIRTAVQMLEARWEVELTLANRTQMGFRMLLGREAIRGRFLLDPARSFLAGRPRKRAGKKRRASS